MNWLREQQGASGLFGTNAPHDFVYGHAIATYAMCEAFGLSKDESLRGPAQAGINYLESHRNPHACWRYQPRDGRNDSSVTSWCILAYASAREFKLEVNADVLGSCARFLERLTDPANGRCGYTSRGELSARRRGDHATRFPIDKGEALTAAGLHCRFAIGQKPKETRVMILAADTLVAKSPLWDDKGSIDHYYWFHATSALFRFGGKQWKDWSTKLTDAVVKTQRTDGESHGSWDPIGAWGEDGGRVYSTALMVMVAGAHSGFMGLVR